MRKHQPTIYKMEVDVNSNRTELVPSLCSNTSIHAPVKVFPVETDKRLVISPNKQFVFSNFPFHHYNDVLGSNSGCVNITNSEEQTNAVTLYSKQTHKSPYQIAIINSENKTGHYVVVGRQALQDTGEKLLNNVSTSHDQDVTIPNYDVMMTAGCCSKYDVIEKNYPNQLCNFEEIPIVPESLDSCKTGLLANDTCMDTCHQDSIVTASVSSISPIASESYCLTQYCFAAEKESLVDEESDYELKLSPTQESYSQQLHGDTGILTNGSSQVSCNSTNHCDVTTTPTNHCDVTTTPPAESVNKIDIINNASPNSDWLVDDGGATLLQDLPLEMAKQTDTLQVCSRRTDASGDNTDDDFNGVTGKTQDITNSKQPNQKFANLTNNLRSNSPRKEPGKWFPMEQTYHNHICNNNNSNLQVVPSDDQSLHDIDYDGPSMLLMAMDSIERKEHNMSCNLSTWERILLSGNHYSKSI